MLVPYINLVESYLPVVLLCSLLLLAMFLVWVYVLNSRRIEELQRYIQSLSKDNARLEARCVELSDELNVELRRYSVLRRQLEDLR